LLGRDRHGLLPGRPGSDPAPGFWEYLLLQLTKVPFKKDEIGPVAREYNQLFSKGIF
jgi:hypothetical protein